MSDGYSHAATALEKIWMGRASVAEAVMGKHNDKLSDKQRRFAYALVCETLKFNEALDTVIEATLPLALVSTHATCCFTRNLPLLVVNRRSLLSNCLRLQLGTAKEAEEGDVLRRALAYVMCFDLLFSGRRKLQVTFDRALFSRLCGAVLAL